LALLLLAISSMAVGSETLERDKRQSASVPYEIKLFLADDVAAGTGKIVYAQLAGNGINCDEQTIFNPTNIQQDRSINAVPKILQCPSIMPISSVALRLNLKGDEMFLTKATIQDTQNGRFYECLNPSNLWIVASAVPFTCSPVLQDYEIKLYLNSDGKAGTGKSIYAQLFSRGTSGDEMKIVEASYVQHNRSMDSVPITMHSLALNPITNVKIRMGEDFAKQDEMLLDKVTIKDNVNQKVYQCVFTGDATWITTLAPQTLSCLL